MEEVRREAVKNTAERTRIGVETYSPRSYRSWNEMLEWLMEELGCNPILVMDVILLIIRMGTRDGGLEVAKENLCALNNYEDELREARAAKKRKKGLGAANIQAKDNSLLNQEASAAPEEIESESLADA